MAFTNEVIVDEADQLVSRQPAQAAAALEARPARRV